MEHISRKNIALSFLELITSGKIEDAYQRHVSPKFRHHNAYFQGDAESLKKGMAENETLHPHKMFEVKHTLEDGDYVAVHSHLRFKKEDVGMVVVHLFRFEDDKIIELWDVGQQIPNDIHNEHGLF